jgi:hypothetical protein
VTSRTLTARRSELGDYRALSETPQRADHNVAQHYPCQAQPIDPLGPKGPASLAICLHVCLQRLV